MRSRLPRTGHPPGIFRHRQGRAWRRWAAPCFEESVIGLSLYWRAPGLRKSRPVTAIEKPFRPNYPAALATFPARLARLGASTRRRGRRLRPPFSNFGLAAPQTGGISSLFFNCLRALRKRVIRKCRNSIFEGREFDRKVLKLLRILVQARFTLALSLMFPEVSGTS